MKLTAKALRCALPIVSHLCSSSGYLSFPTPFDQQRGCLEKDTTEQWEHNMVTKVSVFVFLCQIMLFSCPFGVSGTVCTADLCLWSCSFLHITLNSEELIFFTHLYFKIQIMPTNSRASHLLFKNLHFSCYKKKHHHIKKHTKYLSLNVMSPTPLRRG